MGTLIEAAKGSRSEVRERESVAVGWSGGLWLRSGAGGGGVRDKEAWAYSQWEENERRNSTIRAGVAAANARAAAAAAASSRQRGRLCAYRIRLFFLVLVINTAIRTH